VEARVDVIFDDGNLMARGEFENAAAGIERHGGAGGIVKIGSEDEELDTIGGEQGFESFEINAERLAGLGMRANRYAQAARTNAVEDGRGAGVGGIFEDDGVAGADEGFSDEIESLLATGGDEKSFVLGGDAIVVEKFEKGFLEGRVAIGSTEIEDFGAFAAESGVSAGLQFFDGEEFGSGARHDEGERIVWSRGGEAGEDFFAAFIGEKEFPAEAIATVEDGRRRRGDLQAIAIGADEGAAANVSLDEAFGFEFGVGIGDGGAMDAESESEFAAGGDAITGTQIASVDQGTELVAELNVERNMTFGLKVYWQHCLSPRRIF
jgi:hypothetical protein